MKYGRLTGEEIAAERHAVETTDMPAGWKTWISNMIEALEVERAYVLELEGYTTDDQSRVSWGRACRGLGLPHDQNLPQDRARWTRPQPVVKGASPSSPADEPKNKASAPAKVEELHAEPGSASSKPKHIGCVDLHVDVDSEMLEKFKRIWSALIGEK